MAELYVLQNQQQLFLGKQNNWLDGRDANALYKTAHKDEAINQMVEASSKDYTQRVKMITCTANEKGLPIIDAQLLAAARAAFIEAGIPVPEPTADTVVNKNEAVTDEEFTQKMPDESNSDLADNSINSVEMDFSDFLQQSLTEITTSVELAEPKDPTQN